MKRNKKKKGFTLIELVIVLAVLAIIALIAIPNFNKVREDSRIKADARSLDSIAKIIDIKLIDEKIPDTTHGTITVEFDKEVNARKSGSTIKKPIEVTLDLKENNKIDISSTPDMIKLKDELEKEDLSKITPPQEKLKTKYIIKLEDGEITGKATLKEDEHGFPTGTQARIMENN